MNRPPYNYPTSAWGGEAERGREYFPRTDAGLSADELTKILASDPDRWLVEWTYRIFDLVDSVGDIGDFLEGLLIKYLQAIGVQPGSATMEARLGRSSKVGLVEFAIGSFRSGNRSLHQTCQAIRHGIGGYVFGTRPAHTKDDPELRHAVTNVLRAKTTRT